MSVRIAVYGTLMEGLRNYNKCLAGRVQKIEYGTTSGILYHVPYLNCPALLRGNETVHIEIITLDGDINKIMKELDIIEGYISKDNKDNVYNRVMHKIYNKDTGKEEMLEMYEYNMSNEKASKDSMIYIPSGNWRDYMSDKEDKEPIEN